MRTRCPHPGPPHAPCRPHPGPPPSGGARMRCPLYYTPRFCGHRLHCTIDSLAARTTTQGCWGARGGVRPGDTGACATHIAFSSSPRGGSSAAVRRSWAVCRECIALCRKETAAAYQPPAYVMHMVSTTRKHMGASPGQSSRPPTPRNREEAGLSHIHFLSEQRSLRCREERRTKPRCGCSALAPRV